MTTHDNRSTNRVVGSDAELPTFITHDQMHEAQESGLAHPLSRIITDFVRYNDRWWIAYTDGWVLIDDVELEAKLEKYGDWGKDGLFGAESPSSVDA